MYSALFELSLMSLLIVRNKVMCDRWSVGTVHNVKFDEVRKLIQGLMEIRSLMDPDNFLDRTVISEIDQRITEAETALKYGVVTMGVLDSGGFSIPQSYMTTPAYVIAAQKTKTAQGPDEPPVETTPETEGTEGGHGDWDGHPGESGSGSGSGSLDWGDGGSWTQDPLF